MQMSTPRFADRCWTYYSAEFSLDDPPLLYQFRIWETQSNSLELLIKEDSDVLSRLKVGDRLQIKYYADDHNSPFDYRTTAIHHITKNQEGRLRGHCLVGLELL
jgi:hypothetical protein